MKVCTQKFLTTTTTKRMKVFDDNNNKMDESCWRQQQQKGWKNESLHTKEVFVNVLVPKGDRKLRKIDIWKNMRGTKKKRKRKRKLSEFDSGR
jgi:hypothetical protein